MWPLAQYSDTIPELHFAVTEAPPVTVRHFLYYKTSKKKMIKIYYTIYIAKLKTFETKVF